MHTLMQHHMAHAIAHSLRDAGTTAHPRPAARAVDSGEVVIRRASDRDEAALHLLADLDGNSRDQHARVISALHDGGVLLAEVDGTVRAALPVDGGRPLADPFTPSSGLAELLSLRAGQLRRAA